MDRPLIDFNRLSLVADHIEEKANLLALFFRIAGESLDSMNQALERQDLVALTRLSHSLKGAAANLGMATVEGLCLRLENGDALSTEQQMTLLTEIKDELQKTRDYISRHNPLLLS